jgi:hypothetical protein
VLNKESWPWWLLRENNPYLAAFNLFIKILIIPTVCFNLYFITMGFHTRDIGVDGIPELAWDYHLLWKIT